MVNNKGQKMISPTEVSKVVRLVLLPDSLLKHIHLGPIWIERTALLSSTSFQYCASRSQLFIGSARIGVFLPYHSGQLHNPLPLWNVGPTLVHAVRPGTVFILPGSYLHWLPLAETCQQESNLVFAILSNAQESNIQFHWTFETC